VRFIWGKSWNIPGVVLHVSERLERFNADGAPRRSWLSLRLRRVEDSEPRPAPNRPVTPQFEAPSDLEGGSVDQFPAVDMPVDNEGLPLKRFDQIADDGYRRPGPVGRGRRLQRRRRSPEHPGGHDHRAAVAGDPVGGAGVTSIFANRPLRARLDGAPLDPVLGRHAVSAFVRQALNAPALAELVFADPPADALPASASAPAWPSRSTARATCSTARSRLSNISRTRPRDGSCGCGRWTSCTGRGCASGPGP
jgi:hypothetical protein